MIRFMFWDSNEQSNITLVSMAESMAAPPDVAKFVAIETPTAEILGEPDNAASCT